MTFIIPLLQPSNMLLDSTRHVKLADLGVTEEAVQKMVRGTVGTPAFMAPETLESRNNLTHHDISYDGAALDIWALGVSLYCFVFAEVPFHDHAIIRLHEKILTKELKLDYMAEAFRVSPECTNLISLILNRNPQKRITIETYEQTNPQNNDITTVNTGAQ